MMKSRVQTLSHLEGRKLPRQQDGAILAVSLIIMLVLMIVSLSSSQGIVLQERMTGTHRESVLALQSAEAGLRDAADYVDTLISVGQFSATGDAAGYEGMYTEGSAPTSSDVFNDASWTYYQAANTNGAGGSIVDPEDGDSLPPARYFIEYKSEISSAPGSAGSGGPKEIQGGEAFNFEEEANAHGFRVVVRGTSRDGVTHRYLEALVGQDL